MSDILLEGGSLDDPLINTIDFSDRDIVEIGSGTVIFPLKRPEEVARGTGMIDTFSHFWKEGI